MKGTTVQDKIEEHGKAMLSPALPCNPIPFLETLSMGVRENGTEWIKSKEAKRILFMVNMQAYGQLATIDFVDEYIKLKS